MPHVEPKAKRAKTQEDEKKEHEKVKKEKKEQKKSKALEDEKEEHEKHDVSKGRSIPACDQPPEYCEKFHPADARLSAEFLAALPPEPPPGHEVYTRCMLKIDHRGGEVIPVAVGLGGQYVRSQATVGKCGFSRHNI